MAEQVGRVAALYRYPVKSMAAEALERAEVSWHGLAGDRRWAFVRPGPAGNGFPWLTLRQRNDLNDYRPDLTGAGCRVLTPSGAKLDVTSPELAAELGAERVMKLDRGTFDNAPLSLITTRAAARIGELSGTPAQVLRFRPNLVVEPLVGGDFPEDDWVGHELRIGPAVMRVDQRDRRCVVITVDPATGRRTPEVLRTVARDRENWLGVYGSVVLPGAVEVGDPVLLAT
ncbi:MOSC domain-containing protein [Kineosporia sp. J2-2]|uniref:MOSC domain-containing protein n=1 Tax=Kineosporia corallincola TaxID=2835133 RepID=A0ABS5TKI9_9ACTN|nr:MOSC N-terminal beta barrel domain-containing protein [Kineosporia corallincola]MBT0771618.1 MOSC domain-containing protein [Kineosporia corallincola]